MKKKLIIALTCLTLAFTALGGCSLSSSGDDPKTVIQNAYGNEQFKISFSQEGLDSPIPDVYYTASDIPKLPAPERVGYLFAGWYFDAAYTEPFEDDYLLLKMKDVTLYAKWIEEEFVANGTYAIEYSARIMEETVKKGETTDITGGYKDFCDYLIATETYIEKRSDGLYLRLYWDNGLTVPTGATQSLFSVAVDARTDSSVYIAESIQAENVSEKTVWLSIDKFDLSSTLYLNVSYMNWENEYLADDERDQTITTYTVAFDITRLIGFDIPFADVTTTLDDGYYLVKSYFDMLDGKGTMLENYNSVYSYLYAENGHYTLIKPFAPYFGLSQSGSEPDDSDYYFRLTTYYKVWFAFLADVPEGTTGTADEIEQTFDATSYLNISYEFNADTGRSYTTIDLGDDLSRDVVFMGVASGFMEAAFGTAPTYKKLLIDYDSMIKLTEVDYEELSGDNYAFKDDMQAYAYDYADFNATNASYDIIRQYGITQALNIFFFSNSADAVDTMSEGSRIYSTKITIQPTASTAAKPISQTRYSLAQFTVYNQVYGYDAKDGDLCAQSMTVRTLGGYSLFQKDRIKNGKSCKEGETVSLTSIFRNNVFDEYDAGRLSYAVYPLEDGEVDFSSPLNCAETFTFSRDIAVLYTYKGAETTTFLYEMVKYDEPQITAYNYYPDENYSAGDSAPMPYIEASWMGRTTVYLEKWMGNDAAGESINPVRVAFFNLNDATGVYSIDTSFTSTKDGVFTMPSTHAFICYEIKNYYGETYYYYFEFRSQASPVWRVENENGVQIDAGKIENKTDDDGTVLRKNISVKVDTEIITLDDLDGVFGHSYILYINNTGAAMPFTYCTVSSRSGVTTFYYSENLAAEVRAAMEQCDYAFLTLYFERGSEGATGADEVTASYLYNFSFGGKDSPSVLTAESYFAGRTYTLSVPDVLSKDGTTLGSASLSMYYLYNGSYVWQLSNSAIGSCKSLGGNAYSVVFNEIGRYRLSYTMSFSYDENATPVVGGVRTTKQYTLYLYVDTEDPYGNVTVTYMTDGEHPFIGGSTSYSVTYSLDESVIALGSNVFAATDDVLYAWGRYENLTYLDSGYLYGKNSALKGRTGGDFIDRFNTSHLVLYAVWDKGITVTVNVNGEEVTNKVYLKNFSVIPVKGYVVSLDLASYYLSAPTGYVHSGWTGDVFENGYTLATDSVLVAGDCYITATFSVLMTIRYNINSAYSTTHKPNDRDIIDGYTLLETTDKETVAARMTVKAKDGYTFRYWAVKTDDGYKEFDLYNDAVTSEFAGGTVFDLYAVFEDGEGNLVC